MKNILKIVIGLICIPIQLLHSQNKNSISYFDKNGVLTYKDSALYYRQETADSSNYFRSFYNKTNRIYFEGKIINANDSSDNSNKYNGLCKWYYPNGKLKRTREYDFEGDIIGIQHEYYENGNLFREKNFEKNKALSLYTEYAEQFPKDAILVFEDQFDDNRNNWVLSKDEKNELRSK